MSATPSESQSLIHQVIYSVFTGKRAIEEARFAVSIPYSSGHLFRFAAGRDSRRLLRRLNPLFIRSSIPLGIRGEQLPALRRGLNPLFIRSSIPFACRHFALPAIEIRLNPLFIRSSIPLMELQAESGH